MTKTIALVDDETAHAAYYLKAIEAHGHEVEHFKSPASFLTRTNAGVQFDLFVTDLMMPPRGAYPLSETSEGILTGLRLVEDIRKMDDEAPVLILTNVNISGVLARVETTIQDSTNVFLVKKAEYPPEELATVVNAILSDGQPFPDRVGILRRFFNSLLLTPNFFGLGLDLRRLVKGGQ